MEQGGDKRPSVTEALISMYTLEKAGKKTPGKKKSKKQKDKGVSKVKKVEDTSDKNDMEHLPEDEDEFEYNWPTCACGMNHPPVPHFKPPDGIRCSYYWQIADSFPFLSLFRVLTSEINFIKADKDQSGLIELPELRALLKDSFGTLNISDRLIERTFKEIDLDGSGTIDFFEVLTVMFAMIQREKTNLPHIVQNNFSKVCSIQ